MSINHEADIHKACKTGNLELVKKLIDNGINIESKITDDYYYLNSPSENRTPLHYAAICRYLDIVKYLIEKGADINYQKDDRWSALHLASYNNKYLDIVEYLVNNGADIYSKNKNNKTPLDVTNNDEIKDFLRERMMINSKMMIKAAVKKPKK